MTASRPISCPVLVGREDLLDLAGRRLGSAVTGQGHLLLIAGEAGIGKTRLLTDLLHRARGDGASVLAGATFPRDMEVAGAPLLDLARSLTRNPARPLAAVGQRIVARLANTQPAGTDDEHRRRRLMVLDLADLLAELARDGAALLALEDLHWADDLTLEVLGQLARRLRELPLLVVGTYRSDELYPRVPMREWRSRLLSQRLAEEVSLPRMTLEQTATMTSLLLGGDVAPATDVVVQVQQRSDGVPLHIEEIVGGIGRGLPGVVPDTLSDAVLARSAALTRRARAVASAAAVIGRRFELDLLAEVLDEAPTRVDPALQELQDHFFVVTSTGAPAAFDFRHALIRDALYDRVPPARRGALHGRIAAAAARRGASAAFLSVHYELAGLTVPAHACAIEAARDSARLGAHREALELYHRAVRTAPADLSARGRADVTVALAAEAAATDDNDLAATSYAEAADLLREAGDELEAAALVPPLVAARHLLGDDLQARLEPLRAALAATEVSAAQDPGRRRRAHGVRANLLAGIAAAYMLNRAPLESSIEHGEQARALAAEVGDEATEIDALVTVGSCQVFSGRMEEGWKMLADGVRRAVSQRREAQAARAYRMIGSAASVLVEYDRAEQWLREGIEYAERVELWNHRHYMAAHLAHVLWAVGDWAASARLTEQALADGRGGITTRITCLHNRGFLALGRGAWAESEAVLGEARRIGETMGELQRLSPALWGLAEGMQLQGRDRECITLCRSAFEASTLIEDTAYLFPFLVTGTRALLGLGDLLEAQHWVDDMTVALLRGGIPGTQPAVDHARGLLALARGTTRGAGHALKLAREGWSSRRRTWEAAAALVDLAQCALRANRQGEAVRTAKAAIAEAQVLGAVPLQRRAERVLDLAQQRGGTDEPWAPLSAREFQVAKLLAAGMTNRQIAGELRIAPKTVAAHVAHILTRLDAARRTEIAAWVASVPRAGSL